jgi:hypothetical protein
MNWLASAAARPAGACQHSLHSGKVRAIRAWWSLRARGTDLHVLQRFLENSTQCLVALKTKIFIDSSTSWAENAG